MVEQSTGGAGDARTKWSFARVVQLMYEQQRTGILDVSGADGEWQIHLREGQVVNVVPVEGRRWMLGDVLVATEAITEEQLLKALKRAKRSGGRIGKVLIESELISPDVLKKYLDLQMRETLFPLFQMLGITATFRKEPPDPLEEASPVPIPWVLKEAQRRVREWPLLEKRVPSLGAVYAKEPGTIREILGSVGSGVREVDPDSLDELAAQEAALEGEIGGNERIVYYYVNGQKTVAQLALASGLGQFETTKALYRLAGRGYVRMLTEEGEGERQAEKTIFPVLFQIAFYLFLAAVVGLLVFWRIGGLDDRGLGLGTDRELAQVVRPAHRERVRRALDAYHAEVGAYPQSLAALVEARYLQPEDVLPTALGAVASYERLGSGDRYALHFGDEQAAKGAEAPEVAPSPAPEGAASPAPEVAPSPAPEGAPAPDASPGPDEPDAPAESP